MKHLFRNEHGAGEIIAADTLDDAARYHDCELGGQDAPDDDWVAVDGEEQLTLEIEGRGEVTRLARDWARDHEHVALVGTMYT